MTQKRRTGKYPFNRGRNKGRVSESTTGAPLANDADVDEEIINIVEVKENAQDFFEKNQTLILSLLVGLVLAIGGYMVYKYMIIAPKEKAAIEAMRQAQTQFARDSFALALENPGGGFEGFLDIIDSYSGTNAGNTAKLYAGLSYLNLGKYESAIEYLDQYSANDNVTPAMKQGALGDAYAEMGDLDKAMSYYKKAVSANGDEFTAPHYMKKLAYLQFKNGNKEEAKNTFQSIVDKYPTALESTEAEKFIARLN